MTLSASSITSSYVIKYHIELLCNTAVTQLAWNEYIQTTAVNYLLTMSNAIFPSTSPTTLRGGFSFSVTPVKM